MMPFARTRRALQTLLALTAASIGTASAASGCTAMYATTYGTTAQLRVVYPNRSSSLVYSPATGNLNGAALNPVTGEVFYVDRSNDSVPVLRKFNPTTRVDSTVGTLTQPGTGVNIGATFDNSTGTARLYLLFNNYQLIEVNPSTAATVRTIEVVYPATDADGFTAARFTNTSGALATSGDFVFAPDGTTYATMDGQSGSWTGVYFMTLGKLSSTAGSYTLNAQTLRAVKRSDGTYVGRGNVNGLAYEPVSNSFYTSYVDNSANTTGVDSTLSVLTPTTGQLGAPLSTNRYTDLSDCALTPDAPAISKTFSSAKQRVGTNVTLTITLANTNPSPYYTQNAITDALPGSMRVAATPNSTTTCRLSDDTAAPMTATAGAATVTLPANLKIPPNGCSYTVQVTSATAGVLNNTIAASSVITTAGTPTTNAAATTQYQNALVNADRTSAATITKTQALCTTAASCAAPVTTTISGRPGQRVEYCLTARHPGSDWQDATNSVIGDVLDNALQIDPNAYGTGLGVRVTRTPSGGTATTSTLAIGSTQTSGGAWRQGTTLPYDLRVDITPFTAGVTVMACFQATVR